jgi:signal transduction histidine kinase
LRTETLDPAALLRETAARWDARLSRDGCTLAVEAPSLPPVRGDREALLRALGNLVDNARKYARADRRIELSGAAANGSVKLTVRDHGPGIPVRHRDQVLQPFTRLERADRKETPGTGLGLSLVVACMEAHGGRVEIGTGADGGAAVTLVLPAEETA